MGDTASLLSHERLTNVHHAGIAFGIHAIQRFGLIPFGFSNVFRCHFQRIVARSHRLIRPGLSTGNRRASCAFFGERFLPEWVKLVL